MAKPKLGSVYTIPLERGQGYFQHVLTDPDMGPLIRVFPGKHTGEPDIMSLVAGPEQFWVFFPLGAAIKRKIVREVGSFPAPSGATAPAMKVPMEAWGGKVHSWSIGRGDERKVVRSEELTDEEAALSTRAIINDTALARRIEIGWRPNRFTT